jgi:hypothetical protein
MSAVEPEFLTVADVAAAFADEPPRWVAQCYGVALSIVGSGLAEGRAAYGHYYGPIARGSHFEPHAERPFQRHGWVLLADGRILDPTRWVFEAVEPYLCLIAPSDQRHAQYDEGGDRVRSTMGSPAPPAEPAARLLLGDLDEASALVVADLIGHLPPVSHQQAAWISSRSLLDLGDAARPILASIDDAGWSAFIPVDHRARLYPWRDESGAIQTKVARDV